MPKKVSRFGVARVPVVVTYMYVHFRCTMVDVQICRRVERYQRRA